MAMQVEVTPRLAALSNRVQCVDLHPTKTWILAALYSGDVHIWDYSSGGVIKEFNRGKLPARVAKFVPRMNWVVIGSDDGYVLVCDYQMMSVVKKFKAHELRVQSIAIHPIRSYLLTAGYDMQIILWNWDSNWKRIRVFMFGHYDYVTQVIFNPDDDLSFATASSDRTIMLWNLSSRYPDCTFRGHNQGVNCIAFFHVDGKLYLISGSDDRTVKIWDHGNQCCVQTLRGHTDRVTSVAFYAELSLLVSGSEDGTIRLWSSTTHHLVTILDHGLARAWSVCCSMDSNNMVFGYDRGAIMISLSSCRLSPREYALTEMYYTQNSFLSALLRNTITKRHSRINEIF